MVLTPITIWQITILIYDEHILNTYENMPRALMWITLQHHSNRCQLLQRNRTKHTWTAFAQRNQINYAEITMGSPFLHGQLTLQPPPPVRSPRLMGVRCLESKEVMPGSENLPCPEWRSFAGRRVGDFSFRQIPVISPFQEKVQAPSPKLNAVRQTKQLFVRCGSGGSINIW